MFPPDRHTDEKLFGATSRFLSRVEFFLLFLLDEPHSLGLTIDPCAGLTLFKAVDFA